MKARMLSRVRSEVAQFFTFNTRRYVRSLYWSFATITSVGHEVVIEEEGGKSAHIWELLAAMGTIVLSVNSNL